MARNAQKTCCLCKREFGRPTLAHYLVVGSRYHDGYKRNVVFRGYVCEMHYVEECKECRILSQSGESLAP
jgi:hypothetical protein